MGMSASQARLLSLTARMHDLEFQAQGLQYSKLDLVNLKNDVYDEYLETLDSTKMQMAVLTTDGKVYQDLTYTNMVMSLVNGIHPMYMLTNDKDQIYLPIQIAKDIEIMPDSLDEFLKIVARNYLYSGRADLSDSDLIPQMNTDGNYDYWTAIYHQIGGYKDDEGKIVSGRGFSVISAEYINSRVQYHRSRVMVLISLPRLVFQQIRNFGKLKTKNLYRQPRLNTKRLLKILMQKKRSSTCNSHGLISNTMH